MARTLLSFASIAILLLLVTGGCVGELFEKKLIKNLLEHYEDVGKVGRPVMNISENVMVKYGLGLIQILDLDEKKQVLTTNVWCRYAWKDILLTWKPEDYGGVQMVRIPTDKIWTPDIVLYNFADERLKERRNASAVVMYDGSIMWIPPAIFRSSCPIDITHFPFDVQECFLKFGSWTYDGFQLDLSFYEDLDKIDLNDFIPSNEWDLLEFPARKNDKYYPCCNEPYPDLTFYLKLKRKVAFYNYILILPCVLLSTLTLVLFWLPPESPAKMVLGINIFVAFFVLLLLLAESTPDASDSIPLIGAYYCVNMIMITLSTFLSVIVINLYFRGDRKNLVPKLLRCIFIDYLARILCMRNELLPPEMMKTPSPTKSKENSREGKHKKKFKCPEMKYNKFQMQDVNQSSVSSTANNTRENASPDKSPMFMYRSVEGEVREIRRYIREMVARLQRKEEAGKVALEWRIVALVLDRMFFFLYLAAIIVSLATVFPRTNKP